ncbi:hypothetical protein BS78_02G277100 [Paspalum vaginatum]|nr:hypothetical protein BS78_02G277100 [Paspalum vaginatum]KAJ1290887.1 hypothetical protein BS78_02G277100 [Paspalum vaginatum]KAJ1290888.1 hypothetical protein BS78_02G277100 [Paspalum vaginatum]
MEFLSDLPLGTCRRRTARTEVDHISGLPDDLLLQILACLRCARTAARTSLLSRRWRGLWRLLPDLSFRGVFAPGALETALAQVASTELGLLDINDTFDHLDHWYSAAAVASLLRAAARLAPVVLGVAICGDLREHDVPVEVPIFHRAKSIEFSVRGLYLTPAPGGEFHMLERLSVSSCRLDTGFLLSQCPCLRVLELRDCWGPDIVMVHSTTIEELTVSPRGQTRGVDIVAPALNKLTMNTSMDLDFNVSFLAPMVKDLSWLGWSSFRNIGISEEWRLPQLDLQMKDKVCGLNLTIETREDFITHLEQDLMQLIAPLPNFSFLRLSLETQGHVFGGMLLNLLGNCTAIQSLKLFIEHPETADNACPPNCPCDQPQDWRSQSIPLMALEEVEIKNFNGNGHEVDFMKLVFRCAPLMKRMSVILAPEALSNTEELQEIWDIFEANPSVECCLYRGRRKY